MSEWISVDDNQPEDGERVICYMRDPRNHNTQIQIFNWWGYDSLEVSHWMPLPEPPEAK